MTSWRRASAKTSTSGSLPATRSTFRKRFILALVLVAVAAGGFAIAFRATLAFVLRAVSGATNVVDAMTATDWWWHLLIPTLGAAAAGGISLIIAKRGAGGVSDVMEAVALGRGRLSLGVTTVKSL